MQAHTLPLCDRLLHASLQSASHSHDGVIMCTGTIGSLSLLCGQRYVACLALCVAKRLIQVSFNASDSGRRHQDVGHA